MMMFKSPNKRTVWTRTAEECYKRGCNCEDCPIQKIMETRCKMKESVLALVRMYGKPVNIRSNADVCISSD